MKWLFRAQHIVQLVVLKRSGDSSSGNADSAAVASKTLAKKDNILESTVITEYLQNGTLGRFIERTAKGGKRIPNRILWRLFLCRK